MRRTIAKRLVSAKNNTAMLTTFNEVDMSALMALREKYQDAFVKKYGIKLGFMSLFAKACAKVLLEMPDVNAFIDGDDIIYFDRTFHDTVDGGPGNNTLRASISNASVEWTQITNIQTVDANGLAGVQVRGTTGVDVIDLSTVTLTGVSAIDGDFGNDTIIGTAGNITLLLLLRCYLLFVDMSTSSTHLLRL